MEEEECDGVRQQEKYETEQQQQPPEIDSNEKPPLPEKHEQQQQLQPSEAEIAIDDNFNPSLSETDPIHAENLAGNNDQVQPSLNTQSSQQVGDLIEDVGSEANHGGVGVNDKEEDMPSTAAAEEPPVIQDSAPADNDAGGASGNSVVNEGTAAEDTTPNSPIVSENPSPSISEHVASIDEPQCVMPPVDTQENGPLATVTENVPINAPPLAVTEDVPINEPLLVTVDVPLNASTAVTVDVPANAPPTESKPAPSVVAQDTSHTVDELASVAVQVAPQVANSMVSEDAPPVVAQATPTGDPSPMVQDTDSALKLDETSTDVSPMIQDDDSASKVDDSTCDVFPMIQRDDSAPKVDDSTTPGNDIHPSPAIDENVNAADQIAPMSEVDTEMEVESEIVETPTSSGKRKRGRPAKIQTKALQAKPPPPKKIEEEDVCFICFDGGNLVLCDRRGCPKAYHPACVNRDEAFFRSKGRWNCGWHICSNCEKGAHYMCYTCTYSLCKGCIKETEFFCVRGNKGFCETCMRTVMLIEKNEQAQVNFDDKSSWEFLFKEYWVDLKEKLALTPDELTQAKNPMKGSNTLARKGESSEELYDANDDKGSDSDGSSERLEVSSSKRKKARGRPRSSKEGELPSVTHVLGAGMPQSTDADWASKELLEFVAHMKNGDKSVLTQYDVQALLLEYIKQNNLRDPRKKSQIVCDSMLENLFGKSRVAHFEMLKLLESHFLIKEDNRADDMQKPTAEVDANQLDGDGNTGASTKVSSDKRRKYRKKGDGRGPQTNLDDYAAVDVHNIKLLYLRRNLMEDLLEDSDKFHDKVVGSFVRIRISGSGAKQDMYRLVQVAGTRKAAEPYKTGKRTADVVLEIQNLNKTEAISIDTISNQEFSEDECKRLRQSIKCGLISRMTVGEVQDKAMSLQAVRVNDWLEMEKLRISHLRDRASEQGRRKDLRECVEKLELLNTPEERSRRLEEIPEVHADPNMDPNYESEEDEDEEDRSQDKGPMSRDAGFSRKGRDPISPGKGSPASLDAWSGARKSVTTNPESGRNASSTGVWDKGYGANGSGESASSDARHMNSWENPKNLASATGLVTGASSGHSVGRYGPSPGNSQESVAPLPTPTSSNISETDKMWHYKDPTGKIQGPFSMVQLRKWSTTGHFPPDLRIWRTTERPEDSILLNDALVGKYAEELGQKGNSLSLPEKAGALSENSWEGNTTAAWTDKNQNDRTVNSSGWEGSSGVAWADRTQMDRANTAWTGRNINERTSNSNWNDNNGFANVATQLPNSGVWGAGSSNWAVPSTDPKAGQSGHSFRGGWTPRGNHAWGGRSVHSPHSSYPYSGQPQRPAFHQGGQQRGGRWNRDQSRGNNWNPNRFRGQQPNNWRGGYDKRTNNMGASGPTSGENWRTPVDNSAKGWGTVETPKSATEGWNLNQTNRNNISNLPSPTPNTSELSWTNQVSVNQWSPTPGSAGAVSSSTPGPGPQVPPVGMADPSKTASGWTEQQQPVSPTPTRGWGSGYTSAPKQVEALTRDFSSPPSPTPASTPAPIPASNHVNP